jgi:hypothetical protein
MASHDHTERPREHLNLWFTDVQRLQLVIINGFSGAS